MQKTGKLKLKKQFATLLLNWNSKENTREMPWKGIKDPYRIWLSEIILQQTRVEQGLSYYNNFISNFPDIHQLADASDEKVFKFWEGLGYYTRCRNLIATARYISKERNGDFPNTYDEIRALKGVGPYTASAIASFAFDQPHAVVDGNVFRVLSRIFGIDKPIDSAEGKAFFTKLANELMDDRQPALYNQAIMDFGAVICKPQPACELCIFRKKCSAFLEKRTDELPFKQKKISIRKRWFNFLIVEYKNEIAVRQRTEKDIWQQLYEFPLIETTGNVDPKIVMADAEKNGLLKEGSYKINSVSTLFRQQLSHQLISGQFIDVVLHKKPEVQNHWIWVQRSSVGKYAFPGLINQYLRQKTLQHPARAEFANIGV
jgi:A/G-specific adenine glycosylase